MSCWVLDYLRDLSVERPLWIAVFFILTSVYLWKRYTGPKLRLPPKGPRGLPFVGFLPFMEPKFHLQLTRLRKTYGDMFSIQLGSRYAVVLNDFKAIKEANNKDEFSGRPPGLFKISDNINHMGDMNHKDWKETRRFSLTALRTLGMGKNQVEEMILEQVSIVLDSLAGSTGKTEVNLHSHLYEPITNTIIQLIFGKTVVQSPSFSATVDSFSKTILEFMDVYSTVYFLPVLKPFIKLFHPKMKGLKKSLDEMENIMWKEIDAHEKEFDDANLTDYMDFFISEMKKGRAEHSTFTKATLNGNSQLLLMAGSDTIRTTIEWTMLYMAKHPEVQDRAYQEIVQVLGKERPPTWNDRESLPYVESVILEVSRIGSLVPLGDPHWTLWDTTVCNYDIPKDTYILNNIHAVHMDPNLWENPEDFNPDRFLTDNGKKCKAPEYLIPFAYGKRICPGEKLANVSVFLFVASILQRFKILPPLSGLNMEAEVTLVLYPSSPFVRIEQRE